ncbi:MAG: M48 family metalloprotease [Pseudomonadota bacterium]
MRFFWIALVIIGLGACTDTTGGGATDGGGGTVNTAPPKVQFVRSGASGLTAYRRVTARMEPVAERICRDIHPRAPRKFCDFQVKVINDPRQPPNAFQSIGRDGRPIIAFNINMLRTIRNDHEIAFIFGHEAGHQIARHIEQTQSNAVAGALIGAILVAAGGGDASVGVDIGSQIGGRSYSKKFELEADRLGAYIADRGGYDPAIGAKSFDRTRGSSALLATHPPSAQRKATVSATVAKINAAKAQGKRPPIIWR